MAQGLQHLPLNDVPSKWDPVWFRDFVRDTLALADARNAIPGPGIQIDGQSDVPATISSDEDLQNLLDQNFLLVEPSDPADLIPNSRVIAGEEGFITITDGGPSALLTVGIDQGMEPFWTGVHVHQNDIWAKIGPGPQSTWHVGETLVEQWVPLVIRNNDGLLIQNEGGEGTAGIEMLSFDGFDPEQECGNQLAFWESPDRTNGFRFRHNGEEDIVGDLLVFRHDNDLTGVEVLRILRDTTQVCIAAGSVTEPILAFIGDEDTGMYSGTADTIRFTCGGSQVIGVNGTVLNVNVPVRGPNGSAATPSFSFQNDTDSGLYDISDNSIGVSLAGVLRLTLTASQFTATVPWRGPNGSSSAPTFSFSGDTDTGVLSAGTNTLGISTGGQTRFELDTSKLLVNMDSVNVPADTLNADTDFAVAGNGGGKSLTIVSGGGGAVGVRCISSGDSLASPDAINVTDNSYLAFIGGAGYDGTNWQTGSAALFGVRPGSTWSGSNRESFLTFETTASGSTTRIERARINGVGQILAVDGTAALPEYSFTSDPNTGFYRVGTDQIGVSTNGTLRLTIDAAVAFVGTLPWRGPAGTAGAPTFSFSGDTNTGIFSDAGDTIKLATNGAEVARFDANATAGNTRFLVFDVDNNTLERVSVGVADSGGAGFKVLRIPN